MSSATRSMASTAPPQRLHDLYDGPIACERDHCLSLAASRPHAALPITNNEPDGSHDHVAKSCNVTNSHFHRRKQLEARLAELQKDVAILTLKLRFDGNCSPSFLGASSTAVTSKKPQEEPERIKKPGTSGSRRKRVNEQLLETKKEGESSVQTLEELDDVTVERDQLKLDHVRMKRALAAARKKCENAGKFQKAYDELVVHCGSLQKSLDLSERIRMRQQKLLQQLQSQQRQMSAKDERKETKDRVTDGKASSTLAGESSSCRSADTALPQTQKVSSARGYADTDCRVSNSRIASAKPTEEESDDDRDTLEQAASEPTSADTRPKVSRPELELTTPKAEHLHGVDSRDSSPIASTTTRRPSRAQARQLEVMRHAAMWARSRGVAVKIPTSTSHTTTRGATAVVRPKNGFLAPTQASLRRLHDLPRRKVHYRPPFVV
ncbi:unnamed protein product [Hyaloperonospora brassicae]|uniref:Shugoshin C-terminal domain-containing protein n=1 Tax=Hyaloperonospora brassicae TaxID=162125 RepID=A0AAV0TTJ3_HYABA|nr:unnamed protein product [Hyaloperonospora brassicae]